jgi:hypothetical protein
MKFEEKFPDFKIGENQNYQTTCLSKGGLGECDLCGSFTKWVDNKLNKIVCSEECCANLWKQQLADSPEAAKEQSYSKYRWEIEEELKVAARYMDTPMKDIIIIVHDQLDYLKDCIQSIKEHTKNYKLYIWDNGSQEETKNYLERLWLSDSENVELMRSEQNIGFIQPNNQMVNWGKSDYIILLNSDTKVFEGWDSALIGHLIEKPEIGVIGYLGGLLDEKCMGCGADFGWEIDYVMGWCLCISRKTYKEHGLFNKQLKFAYCEDSELSLRLNKIGLKPYALHVPLVHHYGNKTIKQVMKEKEVDVFKSFESNHTYMQEQWADYLKNGRVNARKHI